MTLHRIQLSIDPYFNREEDTYDAGSSTSSPPPFFLSPTMSTSSNVSSALASPSHEWRMFYVLCRFEFTSEDPDHLPFRSGEILEIVKKEDSGWWAALRGERIGWIPSAFVTQISDEHAGVLRKFGEDLRIIRFEADKTRQKPKSAPASAMNRSMDKLGPSTYTQESFIEDGEWNRGTVAGDKVPLIHYVHSPCLAANELLDDSISSFCESTPQTPLREARLLDVHSASESESEPESVPHLRDSLQPGACPPSPTTPMPRPPVTKIASLLINKPTPPTPCSTSSSLSFSQIPTFFRSRSDSAPTTPSSARFSGGHSFVVNDHLSLSNLADFMDTRRQTRVDGVSRSLSLNRCERHLEGSDEEFQRSPITRRKDKVRQLTGDDDAQAFHNAKQAQASLPWYLQPSYTSDDIKLEYDGSVRAGTLIALVERLTVDPLSLRQDNLYRQAFLSTYETFASPSELFTLLEARYQIDHPQGLSESEFQEWKERKLRPVQKRVLHVLMNWLEEYNMLQDDPTLAPRLRDFLALIRSPPNLALTAKLMSQSLERILSDSSLARSISPQATPSKRRKISRGHKNDLARIDPLELAEQLTLFEHRLYAKVRARECIWWSKCHSGEAVANLVEFCGTHDRIASWVKSSILQNEGLGKRADTIDFWIKVAEKCRSLSNLASMTAIVAALTSAMITRLHLTWAHVGRDAHLQALAVLNEPAGNFSAYRALHQLTSPPCVPFIAMFLTDIVHIQDQLKDSVVRPLSSASTPVTATIANTPTTTPITTSEATVDLINFVKRLKWYDAVHAILRFQKKAYDLDENASIMSFISDQLSMSVVRNENVLWKRSAQIQQNEMVHADIRKGLEAAGF